MTGQENLVIERENRFEEMFMQTILSATNENYSHTLTRFADQYW